MREPTVPTYCPECGEPVYRRGVVRYVDGGGNDGKQRYKHRQSQHLTCEWWGTEAVGAAQDALSGVDRTASRALKAKILANHGGRAIYVITAAQNATPVNGRAWETLLAYCKANDAQLLVVPYRYRNPTSQWSRRARSWDWWAEELRPYMLSERVSLNKHLILLGDIMTQPTAVRPLEGFETITRKQSGIIGHPKLELITVPTPQARLPKVITTTGAITRKNYIPSKAGKKGEFHHTFGAVVVEIDGPRFHMRQINITRGGSFCDLLTEYDGRKRRRYKRVSALVMGDTHVEVIDPQVAEATFTAPDSIVSVLRPEQLVWHDVHDGTAKNHHDRGKRLHRYVKYKARRDNVEAEVNRTLAFIDSVTPEDTRNVIVAANHNEFLREWLENTDPLNDPENGEFWAETYLAIIRSKGTKWTPAGVAIQDPFACWGATKLRCADRTTFLRRDQAYQILGIEVGYHGDRGPSGTRGSLEGFRKIGVKSIIGHGHAPGIRDGAYQVGTSSRLNLTYAAGTPSGWLHTHAVIYPNGKRALISIIDGRWRASDGPQSQAADGTAGGSPPA